MKLVAATYNIHGGVGMDRRHDHARTLRVLESLDADVIALQEVDNYHHEGEWRGHLDYFAEALGCTAVAGPTLLRHRGCYGNAILSRLPVSSTRRIEISVRDHEPRGVLEVVVDTVAGPVRVVATHLGLRLQERLLQAQTLSGLIGESAAMPLILCGDFNEWLKSSQLLRQIESEMGAVPGVRSFPSPLPVLSLDRIWVRPSKWLRSIEAVATRDTRFASDHLPVRAVLET